MQRLLAVTIFAAIMITVLADSQTYAWNGLQLQQLKTTKKCPGYDLSDADLSSAQLGSADLSAANLKNANLSKN